jgi:cytochrome c oxidase subunit 2
VRRDLIIAAIIWAIATAVSLAAAVFLLDPFPTSGAEEAEVIDDAFLVLTYMATPVFGLVVAVLAYSLFRFRSRGEPTEDGPAMFGRGTVPRVWVAVTAALAVVVMINPGLTGLAELRSNKSADLEVNVTGMVWQWLIEYPESGVELISAAGDELVLPAGRRIQFNVTSLDVLHSFWVPAFRVKADAVPGQTYTIYVTLTRTGAPDDVAYRVQCAELCGLNHTDMSMPVRVVEPAEFDRWLQSKGASAARTR